MLAGVLETGALLVFTWRDGGPPAPHPLRELQSRQVGRHTYTVLSEILDSGQEACCARYLYRITDGDKVAPERRDHRLPPTGRRGTCCGASWRTRDSSRVKGPKDSSPGASPEIHQPGLVRNFSRHVPEPAGQRNE